MKKLEGLKIGVGVSGSFCTINKILEEYKKIKDEGADLYPVMSYISATTGTRFNTTAETWNKMSEITHNNIVTTIEDAEPFGPSKPLDAFIIGPCTGNTLAKLANGIIDTPVLMAAKATLRNLAPVIVCIATNDGLGLNMKNIGTLLNSKNIYFVPFGQDQPIKKPNSLVAYHNELLDTVIAAIAGKQIQPIIK